jgi:hypothetical protein
MHLHLHSGQNLEKEVTKSTMFHLEKKERFDTYQIVSIFKLCVPVFISDLVNLSTVISKH